jgi:glutamyl-tRNA synthetase
MHLGNLYNALTNERLAHQSGGVFYLRVEDTDQKREIPGGVPMIIDSLGSYGLSFDEGALAEGDNGAYGPYRQRQRAAIYHVFAKKLVKEGKAYPCFCTEEELAAIRERQTAAKETPGYYGEYAAHRNLTLDEIKARLGAGEPFVLRFRSEGNPEKKVKFSDMVKGELEFPENNQDVVLLKSDGIPTYHFAHVVDDHLMRTTHVVRGEEWYASAPIHVQLFAAMGWKLPRYIHTASIMKMDGDSKRKLSKRKDPEAALNYYKEQGFTAEATKDYIMTLLNSNFEEWRIANPAEPLEKFPFNVKKMGVSGALFDMDKLRDVSKNVLSRLTAEEAYAGLAAWAEQFDQDFYALLSRDPAYATRILAIGRGGKKPRKDLAVWSEAKAYMGFFYDELFAVADPYPENITPEQRGEILTRYAALYDPDDDSTAWFEKVRQLTEAMGFAANMKDYKANPDNYPGHVGDISNVLRVAVTGRQNSPDLCDVMRLLGGVRTRQRLESAR